MPSQAASRDVPRFVKWAMIICALAIGAGYAFGPQSWYSASTFDVLRSVTWFPISAWGWVFMTAGFLMISTRMFGHALAMVAWSTWGMGVLAATLDGHITTWGSAVWPFFFVAMNAYEVFRWGQKQLGMVRREHISSFWGARRRSREERR